MTEIQGAIMDSGSETPSCQPPPVEKEQASAQPPTQSPVGTPAVRITGDSDMELTADYKQRLAELENSLPDEDWCGQIAEEPNSSSTPVATPTVMTRKGYRQLGIRPNLSLHQVDRTHGGLRRRTRTPTPLDTSNSRSHSVLKNGGGGSKENSRHEHQSDKTASSADSATKPGCPLSN